MEKEKEIEIDTVLENHKLVHRQEKYNNLDKFETDNILPNKINIILSKMALLAEAMRVKAKLYGDSGIARFINTSAAEIDNYAEGLEKEITIQTELFNRIRINLNDTINKIYKIKRLRFWKIFAWLNKLKS